MFYGNSGGHNCNTSINISVGDESQCRSADVQVCSFNPSTVVGALTPPVGLYLFLSISIAEAPFKEAIRYKVPVVLIIPRLWC